MYGIAVQQAAALDHLLRHAFCCPKSRAKAARPVSGGVRCLVPTYQWKCRVCDESNEQGSDRCDQCGANSDLFACEIQRLREPGSSFWSFLIGTESLAYLKEFGKLFLVFGLIAIVSLLNQQFDSTVIGYLVSITLLVVMFLFFKLWWKHVRKVFERLAGAPKDT